MSSVKHPADDREKNRVEGGTLYLVATPIGNLSDLSERAVKVLSEVDLIAAEDTRNSARLLAYLGIRKPMLSYFEHTRRERGEELAARLLAGESCALITDAGTPAISDPGEDLVALCAERGIPVSAVPGPVASIVALTLSGLPTGRFCFEGFLPTAKAERRQRLEELKRERRTMLFHEAPHRLRATLGELSAAFGKERRVSVCRELTKLNEEVLRMTLGEAADYYAGTEPRGEFVLVVDGAPAPCPDECWQGMEIAAHVRHYMEAGMEKKEAIRQTAHDRNLPRNAVYQAMLQEQTED